MTARYDVVLFDLDGTLTDSGPGVTGCVRMALEHMGRPVPPPETLRRFVGPPLFESFTKLCGMAPQDADTAIGLFRERYNTEGVYDNAVYPGIPEALAALREAGARNAVATSKPASMAKVVLEHFGLLQYFDFVSAADESDRGGGKETLILPVLEKTGCAPARAVMVGDTKFDAAGSRNAGVDFLGVLYGFGTEDEMRREGAQRFAHSPADIARMLAED